MHNPLTELNHERHDVLVALRQEIAAWLTKPNRTQSLLAARAKLSPQMLCDILGNRRGVSPETYANLVKALKDPGNKIVSLQSCGQPLKGRTIDKESEHEQFEKEHNEQIINTHRVRDEHTL